MTERAVPRPIVAWHADRDRPYRRASDAYYAIAKDLVREKYPNWVVHGGADALDLNVDWPPELRSRRAEKAVRLFFVEDLFQPGDIRVFSERRWKSFVRRVAKFLLFVDRKRGLAAQLENLDRKGLDAEFQYAERNAQEWMERACAILAYMGRKT